MQSFWKYTPLPIVLAALLLAGLSIERGRDVTVFTAPLYAQMQTQEEPQDSLIRRAEGGAGDSTRGWLRVEVETSYGWFWQKSVGRAYTVRGQGSREGLKAGRLCVRLVAHDSTERCVQNQDSVLILEHKRGLGIPKRTAYVTAWAEQPALDTLRVQLAP